MSGLVAFVTIFLVIYQVRSTPADPEHHSKVKRSAHNGDFERSLEDNVACPGGNCHLNHVPVSGYQSPCYGENCRHSALASCPGGNCVGDPRSLFNHYHKRIGCPGGNCGVSAQAPCVGGNCIGDLRRFFDIHINKRIGCPGGNCFVGKTLGCSGGDCRVKKSADPWDFNSPCYNKNCRRSFGVASCNGGNCVGGLRGIVDDDRRFLDVTANVGCPGGHCRTKRSADPECSGGNCRRNYNVLVSDQQTPCYGENCRRFASPSCAGGNCRRSTLGGCNGGNCEGGSRRFVDDNRRFLDVTANVGCPGGHCMTKRSADPECTGGNCRRNYNALVSDQQSPCYGENCRRFASPSCAGGNCRRSTLGGCNGGNCIGLRGIVEDDRRFLDVTANVGCPGGHCRTKRSADPQCSGGNCRRNYNVLVSDQQTPCYGGNCRHSTLDGCNGGNCVGDAKRFVKIHFNKRIFDNVGCHGENCFVGKRLGCSGGDCRMKRSADPWDFNSPCKDCHRSFDPTPCIGGNCGGDSRRYLDYYENRFGCPGGNCGLFAPTPCVGGNCVENPRRFFDINIHRRLLDNNAVCPGGNCGLSVPTPCVGENCVGNSRRFMDIDIHRRFMDNNEACPGGNCLGARFGCAGGDCRPSRSINPQDDMDNLG